MNIIEEMETVDNQKRIEEVNNSSNINTEVSS